MKRCAGRSVSIRLAVPVAAILWMAGAQAQEAPRRPLKISDGEFSVGLAPSQRRGYAVVLGDPEARFARALARETELTICLQVASSEVVPLRTALAKDGLLNRRIYVDAGNADPIPLADNLADVVFAQSGVQGVSRKEVLRVLRPGGVAYGGKETLTKSWPEGLDDWSHPYHGPDNNPRSTDQKARWPYITQFFAEPYFAPLPQVTVAAGGRIFNFFGHIAAHEREEKWLNSLVAINGWNGTILWSRKLAPDFLVHRNNKVATPDTLYYTEKSHLRIIDAVSGAERETVEAPKVATAKGDSHWKWLGMEDGTLMAVLGLPGQAVATMTNRQEWGGWSWKKLSPGYHDEKLVWGYGQTVVALDPGTLRVRWHYREQDLIDTRATCLSSGRLFLFKFGAYLTALSTKTGEVLWKKTAETHPEFFGAFGTYFHRQWADSGMKTSVFLKCDERALYFAGSPIRKMVVVAARDGKLLWEHPYNNFRLIICPDGLYGIGVQGLHGQRNHTWQSRKFDPLTGEVLRSFDFDRKNCTRPTANLDSIFFRRWKEGTTRVDLRTGALQKMVSVRPSCHSGVLTSNGHVYWLPMVCDCGYTMHGVIAAAPAGEADFAGSVTAENLETTGVAPAGLATLPADWPQYRRDAGRTSQSKATLAAEARTMWSYQGPAKVTLTPPIAVGGWVYVGGSDGALRALDAEGQLRWQAHTGGEIKAAPTFWQGSALVGSGDGYAYSFNAETGKLRWRFRAAPAKRVIPVYGRLLSTWPVATGVVVDEDGTAYFAAGILDQNGVHVYALDATSGRLKWENHRSGQLEAESQIGASVMGPMLVTEDSVVMPGGTVVVPVRYDKKTGACRTAWRKGKLGPQGSELHQDPNGWVFAYGQPYYTPPDEKVLLGRTLRTDIFLFRTVKGALGWAYGDPSKTPTWTYGDQLLFLDDVTYFTGSQKPGEKRVYGRSFLQWKDALRRGPVPGAHVKWTKDLPGAAGVALTAEAVVVVRGHKIPMASNLFGEGKQGTGGWKETPREVVAVSLEDGKTLWTHPLPGMPVRWGVALDREGRVVVTLADGRVLCIGAR